MHVTYKKEPASCRKSRTRGSHLLVKRDHGPELCQLLVAKVQGEMARDRLSSHIQYGVMELRVVFLQVLVLGPEHLDTPSSRNNLAQAYRAVGRNTENDGMPIGGEAFSIPTTPRATAPGFLISLCGQCSLRKSKSVETSA